MIIQMKSTFKMKGIFKPHRKYHAYYLSDMTKKFNYKSLNLDGIGMFFEEFYLSLIIRTE